MATKTTATKTKKKTVTKALKFKDVKKIKIKTIDPDIATQKGLFNEGCYGSGCNDICCEYGCDVDYASYKLILKHKKLIEPLIKAKVEDCFSTELKVDDDYIGGGFRETAVRDSDERCAFHLRKKKGCSLFYLWMTKGLTKRLIPTICRTYPITWHRGHLFVDRPLRSICKCLESSGGKKVPSLYETQKKEVKALFDLPKNELSKIEQIVKDK
ncbi:MAG: hypothetical protein KAS88_00200 [Deltaproteobacteria bacterium]|nr:hypothetical protein [Deltaproteobacteria bacterium]